MRLVIAEDESCNAEAVELLSGNPAGVGYLLEQRVADVEQFTADVRRVAGSATALDLEVVDLMLSRATHEHGSVERLTTR